MKRIPVFPDDMQLPQYGPDYRQAFNEWKSRVVVSGFPETDCFRDLINGPLTRFFRFCRMYNIDAPLSLDAVWLLDPKLFLIKQIRKIELEFKIYKRNYPAN